MPTVDIDIYIIYMFCRSGFKIDAQSGERGCACAVEEIHG